MTEAGTETGYPEGWKPNPGDEVTGKLIDVAVTENGWGPYPVLTLESGGREVAVHAFHDVLKGELSRRQPKIGDELSIKYLGQPQGKNYHAYRVRGGQVGDFNWGQFGDDPEPPAAASGPPIAPTPVAPPAESPTQAAPVDEDDSLPF